MSNRSPIAVCAFLCAISCVILLPQALAQKAVAQQTPVRNIQARDPHKSASLEQARVAGLIQSKYLNQQLSAVGNAIESPEVRLAKYRSEIQPVLEQACVYCHGEETSEASLRIDTLNPDLITGDDVAWWLEVQAVLTNGEMPPADSDDLKDQDRGKIVDWLSNEIQIASSVRRATSGHSSFRRLTRYEYNSAMQDLLGLPLNFAKDLPPEAYSEDGFQNSSEMLHMSVRQLETYRELARNALHQAVATGSRPPVIHWGITMAEAANREFADQDKQLESLKNEFKDDPAKQQKKTADLLARFKKTPRHSYYQDLTSGRVAEAKWQYRRAQYAFAPVTTKPQFPEVYDHVAVVPSGRNQYLTIELGDQVPNQGVMRVRVRASKTSPEDHHVPSLQLHFGFQGSNEGKAVVRVSDEDLAITATTDAPQIYQWEIHLNDIYPRNTFRGASKMGGMPSPSEFIRLVNSSAPQGRHGSIQLDFIEITAPVFDEWPPKSHQQIFGNNIHGDGEVENARQVLTRFMTRAFRRSPSASEVDGKVRLFQAVRKNCDSFEKAVVEVLGTVLSSPSFLYVTNEANDAGKLSISANELASRLSLFLWSSVPDRELRDLAESGQLMDRDVLMGQVDRMLTDFRGERFSQQFVHQWLDMQLLEFQQAPRNADPALKQSMQQEPVEFFEHILRSNKSVLNFIHSDVAMLNETLAQHYGVPNVRGNKFRPVSLGVEHRRGGLLTQAGLLTMNADGKDSHPLKRGVWLLKSVLNDPPPPPPPAVPEIDLADPAIAKMTLKERIEDHRNHPACMSCHSKIDPWGIAFENYDAAGRFRTQVNGKPVDASSLLYNDQELDGMNGLKQFLLQNRQDQFVRALVYKLATYSLGRPLAFNDYSKIDNICVEVRRQGDGLTTMIKQLVVSDLFTTKRLLK